MTLKEIFDQLTFGELSQLSVGGANVGEINENNYMRVLPHVNLAMSAIYKRFTIKFDELIIQSIPRQYIYKLNSKFAIANNLSTEPVKYIYDNNAKLFTNNVIKVEQVYTDLGIELPINDLQNMYSVYTPTLDSLRFPADIIDKSVNLPEDLISNQFTVLYRAKHDPIGNNIDFTDVANIEVELPDAYLELLLLFIAARMHAPMGAGQFEGLATNNYMARYEQAAQQIELQNIKIDQGSQNTRLKDKGWA